jgi:transposase
MSKTKDLVILIQDFDFLACYKVERDPRIKIKLLALCHLQSGKSILEVAEIIFYDAKVIKTWPKLFVAFDYEGLIERKGRGRKPRLPKEDEELFLILLDDLKESRDGGRITAYDIQNLLFEEFDCNYSISGVYALLDRLNVVWITGRSKHPKYSQAVVLFGIERYSRVPATRSACEQLKNALKYFNAKAMIVGHTIQGQGINSDCDEKI